jgi:sulfotransferase family protein
MGVPAAPIFVVGCGRSGTTLVQDLLSHHPDLAWISKYTDRWPMLPQLALLSRVKLLSPLRYRQSYLLPAPREGYRAWDHWDPRELTDRDRPLTEADAGPLERARIRRLAELHIRYQGAKRFLNKNTRNSRRIRYLDAIFPDALFIHVLRDPRAVVASLLKVHFWPDLPLWWQDGMTPRQMTSHGRPAPAVAAEHWRRSVERLLDDARTLSPSRYFELRYETLVADPVAAMEDVCGFAGLRHSPVIAAARRTPVRSRNDKFATQLTAADLEMVAEIVQPLARRVGYDLALEGGARATPRRHGAADRAARRSRAG